MTTFIGVDLAWKSERNSSAIAVANWTGASAKITDVTSGIRGLDEVVAQIERHASENTVVAIDAPLIIRNLSGRRPCESAISQRFGGRHASAHSSNLTLYPEPATHELVRRLERDGFGHCVATERQRSGRWFFEVYPHPAQIVLFRLPTIIKYKAKSGRPRLLRDAEFRRLQMLLVSLQEKEPALGIGVASSRLSTPFQALRGQPLKDHEDALDAWFCTYLALHMWYWGNERTEVVGDFENGYIVLPVASPYWGAGRTPCDGLNALRFKP